MDGDADDNCAALCAMELEALDATYGGGELGSGVGAGNGDASASAPPAPPFFTLVHPSPPTIAVHLTPRGVGPGSCFCEARLTLAAPEGYPACSTPVSVSLSRVRGLGDARQGALLAALASEAAALVGDAALGTLIEAGLDGVTRLNAPEGACPLCLDPLVVRLGGGGGGEGGSAAPAPSAGDPPKGLLKLACYHCLHL